MKIMYKNLLILLGMLLFSVVLNSAEHRIKGNPVVDYKLSKDYTWFVVSSTKSASELVKGNLRKTIQVYTQDQGAVTIAIDNFDNGSSSFYIIFNDIDEDRVTITFDKDNKEKFLKGQDPRKDYQDPLKIFVLKDILYFGLSKSVFHAI